MPSVARENYAKVFGNHLERSGNNADRKKMIQCHIILKFRGGKLYREGLIVYAAGITDSVMALPQNREALMKYAAWQSHAEERLKGNEVVLADNQVR